MSEKEIDSSTGTGVEPSAADASVSADASSTAPIAEVTSESDAPVSDSPGPDSAPGAKSAAFRYFHALRRPGRKAAVVYRAVAVLLLAAATATAVFYYVQYNRSESLAAARESARQAACAYGPVLANYDAENLDPYFTSVLAGATGDWKREFADTSKEMREALTQAQVVAKAGDVQCAVKSGDENSAEAVVVIVQTITGLGTQGKPMVGQLSMVLRMERDGDKWLVNKANPPLSPRQ